MGHKVSPKAFRLGVLTDWDSRWFARGGNYRKFLKEDVAIRKMIREKLAGALVADIKISRSAQALTIDIHSARPGMIIGRGGQGIEDLKKEIMKLLKRETPLNINIKEIRQPNMDAQVVAQMVKEQIEKRVPFRRVLKQTLDQVSQSKGVKGVKISVSGRLNGADMSRREWLAKGSIPLHTLRADVDFTNEKAHTTYGVIGIKVWIYKGERFSKKQ